MKNCRTCQAHCDEYIDKLNKLIPTGDSVRDYQEEQAVGEMAKHCEDHGDE